MENLNLLLVNRFDEILEVTSLPGDLSFDVYLRTGVPIPVFVIHCEAYNSFELDSCFTYDDRLKPYLDQMIALMNEQVLSHNH